MDIKSTINMYREKVDAALKSFLEDHQKHAFDFDESTKEAYNILKDFTLGPGKRLRPILLILGYKACGGIDEESIVKASCSLELMQSYLLIHDDVMDLSPLRRGKPTVYKIFEEEYKNKTPSSLHFGISMSILIGNLANHLGLIAISEGHFSPSVVSKALEEYNRVAIDVTFGQILDITLPIREIVTYNDVAKVQESKTSRYSTEGPLMIGAQLAGGEPDRLEALEQFASPLGQAFQIKDDLLGLYGTEEKIGKSVLSDLREGKKTLLVLKALDNGDDRQKNVILRALGKETANLSDLEDVRRIVDETGSRKYSEDTVVSLTQKAKRVIEVARFDRDTKDIFISLADYLLQREK